MTQTLKPSALPDVTPGAPPGDDPRERLSALMDGELEAAALDTTLQWAASPQGREAWHLHHLVGDVLRSPALGQHARCDAAAAVHARLAQEAPHWPHRMPAATPPFHPPRHWLHRAANDPVWRWKAAAACACVTTAVLLAWHAAGLPGGEAAPLPPGAAPSSAVMAVATPQGGGQSIMLRDPQLDALLANAAHQPPPPAAPLQMPAGFLRNAGFSSAGRDCAQARC